MSRFRHINIKIKSLWVPFLTFALSFVCFSSDRQIFSDIHVMSWPLNSLNWILWSITGNPHFRAKVLKLTSCFWNPGIYAIIKTKQIIYTKLSDHSLIFNYTVLRRNVSFLLYDNFVFSFIYMVHSFATW